jgi:adenosylcobyric acid synthase
MGTYIHGLFDSSGITRRWLKTIGANHLEVPEEAGFTARDREYEYLADHFETHVDINAIENLLTT